MRRTGIAGADAAALYAILRAAAEKHVIAVSCSAAFRGSEGVHGNILPDMFIVCGRVQGTRIIGISICPGGNGPPSQNLRKDVLTVS
jgi:TRAP-type C4-dicarboxylate transport system permease large subunit